MFIKANSVTITIIRKQFIKNDTDLVIDQKQNVVSWMPCQLNGNFLLCAKENFKWY